jgi:hypothetical protein
MKILIAATMVGATALSPAPKAEQTTDPRGGWLCFPSREAFADATIRLGDITLNNFLLAEDDSARSESPSGYSAGSFPTFATSIFLAYSITNHGSQRAIADVQLAGFDMEHKLLFVADVTPITPQQVLPGATVVAKGASFVEKGVLARAGQICVNARGVEFLRE